jgi:hypothetical protein
MSVPQRWRSLNELRAAYAASGLELARRHPLCRGKIRYGTETDALAQVGLLQAKGDDHAHRAARLERYPCRWCSGWHVGHRPLAPGRRHKGQRVRVN